ncbi:MAG: thioredoxin domain-containing protein [Mariniblastus sp.]|nr:thioredoxin domain-containing protein [Mariniblastus sp.]
MLINPSFVTRLIVILLLSLLPQVDAVAQEKTGHQHQHTNALTQESSPYLLMHAHNPVNWYAWNEATLELAKKQDKPIFLSIGYSSCHWCHVMERESFLDEEIAKFLNDNFICIKVDREERPDVDEIYMQALMEIRQGGGGWPLSMFMTPAAKPFFGGTYWPARDGDRGSKMGFLTIVTKVNEAFQNNRSQIEKDANVVSERTRESLAGLEPVFGLPVQKSWSSKTISNLASDFDTRFGGFGFSATNPNMPKFPQAANLFFLMDNVQRSKNVEDPDTVQAKKMLITTCERMMMGGIYDHVGGGFHRYSVDRYWKIPHFEKMLYDNGQLATVYAEAYAITGREEFKNVVEGTLAFVDRELVADSGGIYSSLDAESEGEEGKFYRWEIAEVEKTITPDEYKLFAEVYGLNNPPNFEDEYYAPQLRRLMSEIAQQRSMTLTELEAKLMPIRKKLFDARAKRVRPLLDNKILTAWNGLMIRGYADAGRVLKNESYIQTASRAADFALQNLVAEDGRLYRTYTDGQAKLNGYLIDYACLIDGLIALHRASGEDKWLKSAERIQNKQDELFWDEKGGGYFYTSKDHEVLLARSKRIYDNAMPSGNSVAAANLFYLGKHLKSEAFSQKSHQTVLAASAVMTRAPQVAPRMMIAVEEFVE